MSEKMQKCENCLQFFPEQKAASHFGYCRRNIKKCDKCGEMYDKNFLEQHQEQFHKKEKCPHCSKEFGKGQLGAHISKCDQKLIYCQYCELKISPQEYPLHFQACESRTKLCDKCRKPIMNKNFLVHIVSCQGYVQQPNKSKYQNHIENQRKKQRPVVFSSQNKVTYNHVNHHTNISPGVNFQHDPKFNRNYQARINQEHRIHEQKSQEQKITQSKKPIPNQRQVESHGIKLSEDIQKIPKYGYSGKIIDSQVRKQGYNRQSEQRNHQVYYNQPNSKQILDKRNKKNQQIKQHGLGMNSKKIQINRLNSQNQPIKKQSKQPIIEPQQQFKPSKNNKQSYQYQIPYVKTKQFQHVSENRKQYKNNKVQYVSDYMNSYTPDEEHHIMSQNERLLQQVLLESIQPSNKHYPKEQDLSSFNFDNCSETLRQQQLALEEGFSKNTKK